MFTHSELAFLLVMFRRNGGAETVISDRNWENWTGLKDRQKHYAIAGLKTKGLEFDGKGDTAVYRFAWKKFDEFLRHAKPEDLRPKTAGRAVSAPPQFKVHEECAEKGCAKLCEGCDGVQPVAQPAPLFRPSKGGGSVQPVAQTTPCSKFKKGKTRRGFDTVFCKECGRTKDAHVQRVAQTNGMDAASSVQRVAQFPVSFAWLSERFSTVGIDFVWSLAHSVEPPCDDAELHAALQKAYEAKRKVQTQEGLFTLTVPPVIAKMRLAAREKPVRRADLTAAIAGLNDFARHDPRFAPCLAGVVSELRQLEVKVISDELSIRLAVIEAPYRKLLIEVASTDEKFRAGLKKLEAAADAMRLTGTHKRAHIEAMAVIDAQLLLEAPCIFGLLQ